jgi:hypothetical protein
MLGNLICWFVQILFIVIFGMLVRIFESSVLQEAASIMKMTEFCVIPLVQILTSPALQKLFWYF